MYVVHSSPARSGVNADKYGWCSVWPEMEELYILRTYPDLFTDQIYLT